MTEKELLRVHELELVIAEEIKRLCTKHHISYFMIAGTLLGAVRHGGFIPWDEDMDFGMTRKNYDRFVRICQKELDSSRFFLQTMETDPGYTYAFAKIRLLGQQTVFLSISFRSTTFPRTVSARNCMKGNAICGKICWLHGSDTATVPSAPGYCGPLFFSFQGSCLLISSAQGKRLLSQDITISRLPAL